VVLDGGGNADAIFGGHSHLKIWLGGKKRLKIGAICDNFRVLPQISLESIKIATKSKRH